MKKMAVSALLVCLAVSQLMTAGVTPASGAYGPVKRTSQVPQTLPKPVHTFISFNDYQVVGLNSNGWNWVKNDEFILPPDTPLDIDMVQTTHAKGSNVSSRTVYLDGVELPEYRQENRANQPVFIWTVPRFTIPASKLTPGTHLLTFVVTDAQKKSSTVNVKFRVESAQYANIYEGTGAVGTPIPAGAAQAIPGLLGSKRFYANSPGTWKLFRQGAAAELKTGEGQNFYTGTLQSGLYDLHFYPSDSSLTPWKITLQVGLTEIFLGNSAAGQKLVPGQKIVANAAPSTIQLFANTPGRWSVNGTGQALTGAQLFEVLLPERLAGMTVTVTYEPEGGNATSLNTVKIEIPGGQNACDPSKATATMDVLMQKNERSSLLAEKENLASSSSTVALYQNPLYKIWLATAADHLKFGSEADDGEGPGVWAVDNQIVEPSRLNWDHTALDLSSYGPGRYKINYYSKRDSKSAWCGYIQVYEDNPPIPAAPSCEPGEIGEAPALLPVRMIAKNGRQLQDGEVVTVGSPRELDAFSDLTLQANHVVHYGVKKVKKDPSNKKDRRFVWVPDLRWEYGTNTIGEFHHYSGAKIFSENRVEVVYNDNKTLRTIRPKLDKESDVTAQDGSKSLDLKAIIADNGNKPGTYTVEVINKLSYITCGIFAYKSTYEKNVDTKSFEQSYTVTVVVK